MNVEEESGEEKFGEGKERKFFKGTNANAIIPTFLYTYFSWFFALPEKLACWNFQGALGHWGNVI